MNIRTLLVGYLLIVNIIFITSEPIDTLTELKFLNSNNNGIEGTLIMTKATNGGISQQCDLSTCYQTQGTCIEGDCICLPGYTTLAQPFQPRCNYKQKSKFIAFFLEFFFPIGAGHLYAERLVSALVKLFIFMLIVCSFCCNLCFIVLSFEQKFLICPSIIFLISLVIWIIFQSVDLVCFAFGIYKDGNGIDMI
jgi:hypothetical protein